LESIDPTGRSRRVGLESNAAAVRCFISPCRGRGTGLPRGLPVGPAHDRKTRRLGGAGAAPGDARRGGVSLGAFFSSGRAARPGTMAAVAEQSRVVWILLDRQEPHRAIFQSLDRLDSGRDQELSSRL